MKDLITKENKETITSLELVEQINLFRSKEERRKSCNFKTQGFIKSNKRWIWKWNRSEKNFADVL